MNWREFVCSMAVRHETNVEPFSIVKGGLGAAVAMILVGGLAVFTGLPLLIAPLGSSAVLLFGQPSSPLAQPVNVMGGYLVSTIVCETMFRVFPGVWLATAVAVGVTVILMRFCRVTHPPAGSIPIFGAAGQTHGLLLFSTILIGCVALIALAIAIHAIPPRREYPLRAKRNRQAR